MNSFAMIFGHCVWIPPSPKAALVALNLFFGIGTPTQPDIIAAEAISPPSMLLAARPRSRHKTKLLGSTPASKATRCLRKNGNHPEDAKLAPLRNRRRRSTNR